MPHRRRGCSKRVGACFAAQAGSTRSAISTSLAAREKLGSTGLGQGIAIPHGASRAEAGARRVRAPAPAVAFDAPDGKPVSQVFVLLVPEQATDLHLQLLSELAQMFSERAFRDKLARRERRRTCSRCSRPGNRPRVKPRA
jgi:PTS system nitrogen regulatory IIA component